MQSRMYVQLIDCTSIVQFFFIFRFVIIILKQTSQKINEISIHRYIVNYFLSSNTYLVTRSSINLLFRYPRSHKMFILSGMRGYSDKSAFNLIVFVNEYDEVILCIAI